MCLCLQVFVPCVASAAVSLDGRSEVFGVRLPEQHCASQHQ